MTPADYPEFHEAWLCAHAMSSSNQTPADKVVMAVFDVLAAYPLKHVLGAMKVHARQTSFAPTPHHIVEIIDSRKGLQHVGADEAWALVLESFDERSTVVITSQIAEARGLVLDVYLSGDVTGARMAFRDAYTRIIKKHDGQPQWFISAGSDGASRADAIEAAIRLGRIKPDSKVAKEVFQIAATTASVAGLIESAQEKTGGLSEKAKLYLSGIKKICAYDESDEVNAGIVRREQERKKFEAHRQQELKRIAEHQGALH